MPAAPTWTLKYRMQYTNENQELCRVDISGKSATGDVVDLQAPEKPVTIAYPNSDENKFSPIRGSEITVQILITGEETETVDLITFLGADDEWKIDYYKADMSVTNWQGFLVQEETTREMQDAPFILELHGVDGLGWLKDRPLTDVNGAKFTGLQFLLDYIGQILWQLNPYLDLYTHVNIWNIAMDDRDIDPQNDPLAQIKVQARSWQSSATTFEDCYSVLEKIMVSWGCTLYQWNGGWHMVDLFDVLRGATNFTKYTYNRAHPTDAHLRIIDDAQMNVAYECKIAPADSLLWSGPVFPTKEDQTIGLKFANKFCKLFYNYNPWPELPLNNKFDRGTFLPLLSDSTHSAFTVEDWTAGKIDAGAGGFPYTMFVGAPLATPYSYRTYDAFGIESSREIIMSMPHTGTYAINQEDWLASEPIPITQGDKIEIAFSYRNEVGWTTIDNPIPIRALILNDAGTAYYAIEDKPSANITGKWKLNDPAGIYAQQTDDYTTLNSYSSLSDPAPISGTLYVIFCANRTATVGEKAHWTDFRFTYFPYAAGGYHQVKGEYNLIGQNQEFKQTSEEEIYLNDATHGVLKGAMYRYSNVTDSYILTSPVWYRLGLSLTDSFRFIEIQALKRFWHTYRTMQKIEGSFNGLIFFEGGELPLGLLQLYYPEYLGDGKRYTVTDLEEDHKEGTFKATMIESGNEDDQSATVDTNEFNYIFE